MAAEHLGGLLEVRDCAPAIWDLVVLGIVEGTSLGQGASVTL